MGLEFGHPQGAKFAMKRLYENGVWAIFSTLDPGAAVQMGILLTPAVCEELLERTEVAIAKARDDAAKGTADDRDEQGLDQRLGAAHRPGEGAAGPGHAAAGGVGRRLRPVRQACGGRDRAPPPRPA
jgi:hypothetical protein